MLDGIDSVGRIADADSVDLFLQAAAAAPEQLAVATGTELLSYQALAARVRALAGAIAARTERARVLLALPPGADAYAAMFATGMAGGVYAPVNLNAPAAKQLAIAARFAPEIVVAHRAAWPTLAAAVPGAALLAPEDAFEAPALAEPVPAAARHELAYVIFTSGSTGRPKGVEITRAALAHYVAWLGEGLDIRPGDRLSQYANIAFDLSVMEIYGALCRGASLHPPRGLSDRLFPAATMGRERLTHWISVPSVVGLMRQGGELTAENARSVRRFVFCGEPLLRAHVADLLEAAPDAIVQNTYGPTEATVSMTTLLIRRDDVDRLGPAGVALGAPIADMECLLAGGPDENEGELVLFGPQLARGYLGDAEATARAFRPVATPSGEKLGYFTGDWVRRIDGALHFQSRTDFQIKHKGYRIEPGEIEAALATAGAIASVVFPTGGRLVAMVESAEAQAPLQRRLRAAVRGLLDAHAVPDLIIPTELLPRNDNDKTDRNAAVAMFAAMGAVTGDEAAEPV